MPTHSMYSTPWDDLLQCQPEKLTREVIVSYLPIAHQTTNQELASVVDAFNEEVAAANAELNSTEAAVATATASDTVDPEALLAAVDAKRRRLITDAQSLVQLWRRRLEVVELLIPELEGEAELANETAEQKQREVTEALEAIGYTAENLKMVRLERLVDMGHPEVRQLRERAAAYPDRKQELHGQKFRTAKAIPKATEYVRQVAERIASGKV